MHYASREVVTSCGATASSVASWRPSAASRMEHAAARKAWPNGATTTPASKGSSSSSRATPDWQLPADWPAPLEPDYTSSSGQSAAECCGNLAASRDQGCPAGAAAAAAAAAAPEALTSPFWRSASMDGSFSRDFGPQADVTAMAAAALSPTAAASLTEPELEAIIEEELAAAGLAQGLDFQGGYVCPIIPPVPAGMLHGHGLRPGAAASLLPLPSAAGGAGGVVAHPAAAPAQDVALSARLALLVDEMMQVAARL